MNSTIHILSDHLMKRIAAGEVIERPASVVKELLENSLDAGATKISLLIEAGGIDKIQVIDNGQGMTEEDVLICCERHATSKISSQDDLEDIRTLGFRGEALASISSVSRLEIVSMTADENEATQAFLQNGKIKEITKCAPRKGTAITVKDIFSHVPARRKFLKRPATELRYIINAFRKVCLANPDIEFILHVDGKKTYDLRQGKLEKRIQDLLGKQITSMLLPVEKKNSIYSLTGLISRPSDAVKTRKNQFFFLNKRSIINKSVIHAILSAYDVRLERNTYPVYVLFLDTDPQRFDINVHPSKIEVRFRDERIIHDFIRSAVKEALNQPSVIPGFNIVRSEKRSGNIQKKMEASEMGQLSLDAQEPFEKDDKKKYYFQGFHQTPPLWQIHNRYIISQIKSGLTIIDQHVAHERVLYEKAKKSLQGNQGISQQLLFPQTIQLSPDDHIILTEILPFLEKIGFSIKEFGRNTVIIEAVPTEIKTGFEKDLLIKIIDHYNETKGETSDIKDAVAKSFSCKSAIKSGKQMGYEEMASLIDQLFATENPYFCPHGRPIVVNVTIEELDKRFRR
ncbi:MAG: DNA mismatch repair endonuclease MutL [bacterium]